MKKNAVKLLLMTVAMMLFSLGAIAQSDSQQGSQQSEKQGHVMRHGGMMRASVDEQLQHMTKALNLTSDQQEKIRPILEEQHKQAQTLHDDTSLSQDDKRAKFQQMHEGSKQKIRAVLTDEQKTKFDQMHNEHMGGMHKHGDKGDKGDTGANPKQ